MKFEIRVAENFIRALSDDLQDRGVGVNEAAVNVSGVDRVRRYLANGLEERSRLQ